MQWCWHLPAYEMVYMMGVLTAIHEARRTPPRSMHGLVQTGYMRSVVTGEAKPDVKSICAGSVLRCGGLVTGIPRYGKVCLKIG